MKKVTELEALALFPGIIKQIARRLQSTPEGCLEWQNARFSGKNYGMVSRLHPETRKAVTFRVHRLMYAHAYGVVPDVLHHICKNEICCNPAHLVNTTKTAHRSRYHNPRR